MTTGRYSERHTALTALIAIFSTVAGAHLGGMDPMTSCGSRFVPASIRATRSGVGGTIGSPSLSFSRQNQSLAASHESSTSMRGEVSFTIYSCIISQLMRTINLFSNAHILSSHETGERIQTTAFWT